MFIRKKCSLKKLTVKVLSCRHGHYFVVAIPPVGQVLQVAFSCLFMKNRDLFEIQKVCREDFMRGIIYVYRKTSSRSYGLLRLRGLSRSEAEAKRGGGKHMTFVQKSQFQFPKKITHRIIINVREPYSYCVIIMYICLFQMLVNISGS